MQLSRLVSITREWATPTLPSGNASRQSTTPVAASELTSRSASTAPAGVSRRARPPRTDSNARAHRGRLPGSDRNANTRSRGATISIAWTSNLRMTIGLPGRQIFGRSGGQDCERTSFLPARRSTPHLIDRIDTRSSEKRLFRRALRAGVLASMLMKAEARRVLVATDFSESATAALEWAVDIVET